MRIAVDVDSVLNNLHDGWCSWIQQNLDRGFRMEAWTDYDVAKCTSAGITAHRYLDLPFVLVEQDVMPGSQDALRRLGEMGHEVFICTAVSPRHVPGRARWLERNFPFIDSKHWVFTPAKHLLDVDYLIDDCLDNFKGFKGTPIIFDHPWNRTPLGRFCFRVFDWDSILSIFEEAH